MGLGVQELQRRCCELIPGGLEHLGGGGMSRRSSMHQRGQCVLVGCRACVWGVRCVSGVQGGCGGQVGQRLG